MAMLDHKELCCGYERQHEARVGPTLERVPFSEAIDIKRSVTFRNHLGVMLLKGLVGVGLKSKQEEATFFLDSANLRQSHFWLLMGLHYCK